MNPRSTALVAALLAVLPVLSHAQVQRVNLTHERAFGHQPVPPGAVCDDRDLVGPYQTQVKFKNLVPRNAPAEFEILFSPKVGDANLRVTLEKGSGLRLVSGQAMSLANVHAGGVYRAKWSVSSSRLGRHPVVIHLQGSELPDVKVPLFVDVHREGITLTQGAPFQSYQEQARPRTVRPLNITSEQAQRMVGRSQFDGRLRLLATATINGQINTWNGTGGWQTAGGALVNVGQWNGSTWVNLWSGQTDDYGNYSASYEWNNATGGATKTIYVYAHPWNPNVGQVVNTSNVLYQYGVSANIGMSATVNIFMNDGVNNELPEGAYKIFDTVNKARNYSVWAGDNPGFTKFVWPSNGSYFIPSAASPDVHLGTSWDEWSKVDVVGHEYGHYHHFRICGNWLPPSPGGSHSFNQLQDPILSLVEGYATFFMNMAFNKTDYLGWINLEDNGQTYLYGQRNEAAVAGAMLDIADNTAGEAGDALNNLWFAWVKDVVKNRPNTMKEFYDRWVAWSWPFQPDLTTTLQTHGMNPPTFSPY